MNENSREIHVRGCVILKNLFYFKNALILYMCTALGSEYLIF